MAQGKYIIHDTHTDRYLLSYAQPDRQCEAYVTQWTAGAKEAMRFEGCKTARGVAQRLGGEMEVRNIGR